MPPEILRREALGILHLRNLSIGEVTDNQLGNVELIFLEKYRERIVGTFFASRGLSGLSGKEVVVEYQNRPLLGYLRSDAYSSSVFMVFRSPWRGVLTFSKVCQLK